MTKAVAINLDELINGREISFPIHSATGVLLLGPGSKITAELKQRLKARGVMKIIMDEADVAGATLNGGVKSGEADKKLTDRLDSILRSSGFGINNTGPALAKQVKRHGRKNYDAADRKNLEGQQQQVSDDVNRMMQQAAEGEIVDGDAVGGLAASCIHSLTADFDSALSVSLQDNTDPTLAQHSLSVAMLGMAIGVEMGLDANNVRIVGIAGLVQDWGMAKVPKRILEANRPLTSIEFLEIQKHPIHTLNLLEKTNGIPNLVRLVAYQSHERLDGSGYPQHREGAGIHLFAKILHVADSYVAMTSERPHRAPLMPYAAMECLLDQARRHKVDPEVVRSLLHVLSLFPIGSYVALSEGSAAQVIRSNGIDYTRPIVMRVQDASGKAVNPDDDSSVIDLANSDLRVMQALPTPGRNELTLASELAARPA